jgi:hypothetical protein
MKFDRKEDQRAKKLMCDTFCSPYNMVVVMSQYRDAITKSRPIQFFSWIKYFVAGSQAHKSASRKLLKAEVALAETMFFVCRSVLSSTGSESEAFFDNQTSNLSYFGVAIWSFFVANRCSSPLKGIKSFLIFEIDPFETLNWSVSPW